MKEIVELTNTSKDRIVLAYSGGVHASAAIAWLKKNFDADVVTITVDLGQGTELTAVRERALESGAIRAHVIEARDEFVRDFILPSLHAGALLQGCVPLARPLAHALLAKRLVDLARMEGAVAVAHASAKPGSGGLSRLDVAIHTLAPSLRVIAVPSPADSSRRRSVVDVNLWGRTIESDEDLTSASYALTRTVNDCPDEPAFIEIEFDGGVPVRANGIEMPMLELIESLEIIAGAHGVGRVAAAGPDAPGMIAEAPAAVVLHTALRHLEERVLPKPFVRVKNDVSRTYADLVFRGSWYSPARQALDAYVRGFQPSLTGVVRVELFKGHCRIVPPGDRHATSDEHATDVRSTVEA